MMLKNGFLFLLFLPFVSYGQGEYPTLIDSTDKGGVSEFVVIPVERYEVNRVEVLSPRIFNLNDVLNIPKLQIGQVYIFDFVFTNPYDFEVVIADILLGCTCTQPTWNPNVIPSRQTRTISVSIQPSAPGSFTSNLQIFVRNESGTIPLASQKIELTYQAE